MPRKYPSCATSSSDWVAVSEAKANGPDPTGGHDSDGEPRGAASVHRSLLLVPVHQGYRTRLGD